MSTQSMAVETMVVAELQDLFAFERELEKDYDQVRCAPNADYHAAALFERLSDLAERASRLERMLEELDEQEEHVGQLATC